MSFLEKEDSQGLFCGEKMNLREKINNENARLVEERLFVALTSLDVNVGDLEQALLLRPGVRPEHIERLRLSGNGVSQAIASRFIDLDVGFIRRTRLG